MPGRYRAFFLISHPRNKTPIEYIQDKKITSFTLSWPLILFCHFMIRWCLTLFLLPAILKAQSPEELTVEKIMRHPKWIGIAPNNVFWSPDSKTLNFYWNPEGALSDSLYSITLQNSVPRKTTLRGTTELACTIWPV